MLRIEGSCIVDEGGNIVLLRGVGLGGWMNMENFITGYPGYEEGWRQALRRELGPEKYELFFDRFLEHFFAGADAAFLQSLGLNSVRLAINYRHFESDLAPFEIREQGFKHLDRVIDLCARHELYTIIDLHAVQGYQNQDWHSDNSTHRAFLWEQKHFQDRAAHLWEVIATRYRGNRWVAGYNLINEPNDPVGDMLIPVTRRLYDTVRVADPDHLVFIDGNRYSSDFSLFTEPWPGVVYAAHDYALCGMLPGGLYPGHTGSVWCDRPWLEKHFLKKSAFMREHGVPIWVGEFGPVYTGDPERDSTRYDLARDQIDLFDSHGAGWAIWTYKDIGLQGVVYAAPDSPYMQRVAPMVAKKARFGTDSWGGGDVELSPLLSAIDEIFARERPDRTMLPWDPGWTARRLVRNILFAEALIPEAAALFAGLGEDEIDTLMRSFAFENCVIREPLARVLAGEAASLPTASR
jgi:hypothetical protein